MPVQQARGRRGMPPWEGGLRSSLGAGLLACPSVSSIQTFGLQFHRLQEVGPDPVEVLQQPGRPDGVSSRRWGRERQERHRTPVKGLQGKRLDTGTRGRDGTMLIASTNLVKCYWSLLQSRECPEDKMTHLVLHTLP